MKATGALPTEARVQRMNDHQWLWYYLNLQKDELETAGLGEERWKQRLDYIGWWINPQLAKSVTEMEKGKISNNDNKEEEQIKNAPMGESEIIVEGDTVLNEAFEEELRRALNNSNESLTELPDSTSAGNPYETANDFIKRVSHFQELESLTNEDIPIGIEDLEELNNLDDNIESLNSNNDTINALIEAGIDPNDIDFFEYPDE